MNKITIYNTYIFIIAGLILFTPVFLFAQWSPGDDSIIPCDGTTQNPCNLNEMVVLVSNIISFFIYIAPFIAAILFAYAGFLYITAGGKQGQIAEAHKIFTQVAIGLVIMLAAWLIVKMILVGLGAEDWAIRLGN